MRRRILQGALITALAVLWFDPAFWGAVGGAVQSVPILVKGGPAALFRGGVALIASGFVLALTGYTGVALRGSTRYVAAILAALSLVVVWSLGAREAPLILSAASEPALMWFLAACCAGGAFWIAVGARARRIRDRRLRRERLERLALNQIAEGIVLCNRRGQPVWANAEGLKLLRRESPALSFHERVEKLVARALETRQIAAQTVVLSESARLNVTASLIPGGVGVVSAPVQGDAARSSFYEQFIRRIVHDMRNPLAAIIAHTGNFAAAPTPEAGKAAARIVEREAGRLTRLVDSLLFDARLAYVPPNLQRIDLADVIEEVYYLHDERAIAEGKSLSLETPSEPAPVEADRDLLMRALSNLIDNSLKYSPVGSAVRLALERAPGQYLLSVIDSGDGIPAEYLPDRIFEPLVRARSKDTGSGSGLGLSIVKKIVELHGGQISTASELGKGTKITLCLPRK